MSNIYICISFLNLIRIKSIIYFLSCETFSELNTMIDIRQTKVFKIFKEHTIVCRPFNLRGIFWVHPAPPGVLASPMPHEQIDPEKLPEQAEPGRNEPELLPKISEF